MQRKRVGFKAEDGVKGEGGRREESSALGLGCRRKEKKGKKKKERRREGGRAWARWWKKRKK